jgi:hypothetical protein
MIGQLEEDSHADIHSAGKDCVMLSTTGLWCDVSPFHDLYTPKIDIEIVQSAMEFQHDNRNVYYLVMTESLWFGDNMEHLLFNGLIAKDTGVKLCTNPYDQCWHLGITLIDDEVLLFQQTHNTVGCQTFAVV